MTEPAATTPAADNASIAEDFIDIFVAPAKVYTRRAKASPMMPFLTVWILACTLFFAGRGALGPIFQAEIDTRMEAKMKEDPRLTQDIVDKMKPAMAVGVSIAAVVGIPIIMLVVSLVVWVLARFVFGGFVTFGMSMMIVSFAWFPRIIESVINLVQSLLLDVTKMTSHFQLTLSVARFLDPATTSAKVMILAGQLDVFSIWTNVLIAIGLIYAGKLSKNNAIITAVIIWLCAALPALWA